VLLHCALSSLSTNIHLPFFRVLKVQFSSALFFLATAATAFAQHVGQGTQKLHILDQTAH
jgi:hypothetical protein